MRWHFFVIRVYHKRVPKRVDHSARRREITDAVCRVTVRHGLAAATFREVASEANVSVRLVQYYFGTKAGLIEATMQQVSEQSIARLNQWIEASDGTPRGELEAFLKSFIPSDDESRIAMHMFVAVAGNPSRAATSDASAADQPTSNEMLHAMVLHQLERGPVAPGVEPEIEAALITAMMPGLGNYLLEGSATLDQVNATIDYHLDRLFPIESASEAAP